MPGPGRCRIRRTEKQPLPQRVKDAKARREFVARMRAESDGTPWRKWQSVTVMNEREGWDR